MDHNSSSVFISAGEHVATALRGLCFLLGICGNIAVVVFLLRHFKRDNFTLQLMLNLAVSDILCLITMPVSMYSYVSDWTMGLPFCKFMCYIAYLGVYTGILTVTLLSVQRYVLVLHRSTWNKLGQRGERALLAGVWAFAGLLAVSPATTFFVLEDEGKLRCDQAVRSEGEKVGLLLLEMLLFYVTPMITMTTSYFCLHKKIRDKARTNFRLTPLVTAIVVTFIIFTTPYYVVTIMIVVTPSQPTLSMRKLPYRGARRAVESVFFLSSCVNPLLYAFNFRTLRQSTDKNVITSNDI